MAAKVVENRSNERMQPNEWDQFLGSVVEVTWSEWFDSIIEYIKTLGASFERENIKLNNALVAGNVDVAIDAIKKGASLSSPTITVKQLADAGQFRAAAFFKAQKEPYRERFLQPVRDYSYFVYELKGRDLPLLH